MGHDLYRMLRTGMPAGWTQGERLVALIIADNVSDRTRTGYIPNEQLCEETGYTPNALSDVLRKLSKRGYEMRIPHGTGKDGRPVFATRGHGTDYQVPLLPPRQKPPSGPALSDPGPVDNDPAKAPSQPALSSERPRPDGQRPRHNRERPRHDGPPTPNNLPNPNNHALAVITPSEEDGWLSTAQPSERDGWLPIEAAARLALQEMK